MYQIYTWDGESWDEVEGTYTTMERDANNRADVLSAGIGLGVIFAVIEDGQDTPYSIFFNGREFPRKPLED